MELVVNELNDGNRLLEDLDFRNDVIKRIKLGEVFVLKNFFDYDFVNELIQYLTNVGKNSLAKYEPIVNGAPNNHLINRWDPRATVGACFHQFNFYPWNGDIFDLFEKTEYIYKLKNVLSGNDKSQYLSRMPEDGITRRLAFQFYPSGLGGLKRHSDPVGEHQLVVPTMNLTLKGKDFVSGGAYVEVDGERFYTDEICHPGDVLFFNAQAPHGVDVIDEGSETNWYQFKGRWMLLFALNSVDEKKPIVAKEV